MFRLIGIAVVIFVLYVGYSSFLSVYEGHATPKEAVDEVRQRAAEAIAPKSKPSSSP